MAGLAFVHPDHDVRPGLAAGLDESLHSRPGNLDR